MTSYSMRTKTTVVGLPGKWFNSGVVKTRSIEQLKRDAKRIVKTEGIAHHEALDRLARLQGFQNWQLLMKARNNEC